MHEDEPTTGQVPPASEQTVKADETAGGLLAPGERIGHYKSHGVPPTLTAEEDRKKLKVDYLLKRIDHTLSFTFTITKLMYLVNGAGLAFIYFAFNKDSGLANPATIGFIVALALAILNLIHANFIHNQHIWYRVDSAALDREVGVPSGQRDCSYEAERQESWRTKLSPIKSAHATFWWFHLVTAIALLALGVVLLKP